MPFRSIPNFKGVLCAALAAGLMGMGSVQTVKAGQAGDTPPPKDTSQPHPVPATPGLKVLFGGISEDIGQNWEQNGKPAQWSLEDHAMVANKSGNISSKEKFSDFQLHIEFRVPYMPDKKGQSRGNSGVFLQGRYEIQVLDSYGIREPGSGDCGAVYNQAAPLVNACKPPLQWQTYDISFRAPRVDPTTHEIKEPARVTVFQNGLTVQNDQIIKGPTHVVKPKPLKPGETPPPAEDFSVPGPIVLQWHGNTVAFRNIWIVPLPAQGATHYEPR